MYASLPPPETCMCFTMRWWFFMPDCLSLTWREKIKSSVQLEWRPFVFSGGESHLLYFWSRALKQMESTMLIQRKVGSGVLSIHSSSYVYGKMYSDLGHFILQKHSTRHTGFWKSVVVIYEGCFLFLVERMKNENKNQNKIPAVFSWGKSEKKDMATNTNLRAVHLMQQHGASEYLCFFLFH